MKIENIVVSNIDINNNSATLTFDIVELEGEVNVNLKVNDGEFKQILEKQKQGTITYELTDIPKGINNLVLKIVNENEEYITEPFLVKLKINPTIEGLECTYSDSTGKFILEFNLLGDESFIYNIYLKLDENEYQEIMTSQTIGKKTFEMISVMGEHTCVLKVTDSYDEYETEIYSFEITNKKPILSMVLVTDVTNEGVANIHYAVKDIENSTLEHKLNIDSEEKIINPTRIDNFYTYEINNLSIGVHECNISITDGIDTVTTDSFNIEIFENSTDKKEILRQSKSRYDSAYQSLKNIIMSVVSDGVFNYDIENTIIQKAQEYYNETYSEFNKVAQQSIDTIGTNKINLTKDDLTNQINDVDNALNTLETTMEGVFKDGVLSDSEKTLLKDNLNLIAKEKTDVDKDYETLYNNEDLLDPAKSKLQTAYDAFVSAQNTLSTTINNIVNKEGIIDNEDKANVDSAFESWRNALGDYRNASLEAIDSIAKKKVDDNADTLDKKWSQLIVDVETGIKAEVGSLETEVENITQKVAELEITDESITSTVSSMQSTVNGFDTRITTAQQTADKINWVVASGTSSSNMTLTNNALSIISSNIDLTGKVTFNSFSSGLKAQADEWDASYNTIYHWAYGYPSSTNTTTINGAYIETGTISADKIMANSISVDMLKSNNANPIIRLFDQCSIDATLLYEEGQGEGIRLKWDNYNYIYVSKDYIGFHLTNGGETYLLALEAPNSVPQFITKDGNKLILGSSLTYKGETVVTSGNVGTYCATSSHTHTGTYAPYSHSHSYASSSHTHDAISYGSASVDCYGSTMYIQAGSTVYVSDCDFVCEYGTENCGTYSYPWRSVVADMLIYLSYCGKADGDEENLTDANVSYNFMKQYSDIISSKQQLTQTVSTLNTEEQNEIFEEEDEIQKAVVEKANAIYEYDEEGINLFTNASVLTETMAQTIEILINKIEELEKTVLDLQNKLGE